MPHIVRHAEAYETRIIRHDHSILTTIPSHLLHTSSTVIQYQKQWSWQAWMQVMCFFKIWIHTQKTLIHNFSDFQQIWSTIWRYINVAHGGNKVFLVTKCLIPWPIFLHYRVVCCRSTKNRLLSAHMSKQE